MSAHIRLYDEITTKSTFDPAIEQFDKFGENEFFGSKVRLEVVLFYLRGISISPLFDETASKNDMCVSKNASSYRPLKPIFSNSF